MTTWQNGRCKVYGKPKQLNQTFTHKYDSLLWLHPLPLTVVAGGGGRINNFCLELPAFSPREGCMQRDLTHAKTCRTWQDHVACLHMHWVVWNPCACADTLWVPAKSMGPGRTTDVWDVDTVPGWSDVWSSTLSPVHQVQYPSPQLKPKMQSWVSAKLAWNM